MTERKQQAGIDHYCVMGNPIAHSKSPVIHQAFARQTGEAIDYQAVLVPKDGFPEAVQRFREQGGKGANVTLPFKEAAWQLATDKSPRAQRAGAVNTLSFAGGDPIHGDNTDGIGLVRDIRDNLYCDLKARNILILGAGGAVRGVIDPLFDEQPARIVIANRSVDKATAIAERFADRGDISAVGYDQLGNETFSIIINGTSLSLQNEVPPLPDAVLEAGGFVYDMMYQAEPTSFMRWGLERSAASAADGLGMLVEQAAESFYLWRGVRPSTAPVIELLRG